MRSIKVLNRIVIIVMKLIRNVFDLNLLSFDFFKKVSFLRNFKIEFLIVRI